MLCAVSDPVPVPLLDLRQQYAALRREIDAAIAGVLETQHFILGPEVEALEAEVARYSGCRHGVGVSSGTDALLVALMALDLGPGDQVVTTSFSFFATAGSVARLGAEPVFVDIDPETFNLDPRALEPAITERTRVLMPVHLYGQMAEMEPVLELARRHGLAVVEDAAQAIGAEEEGRRAGSLGDAGCFSFYPTKNLGAFGDGGLVATQSEQLAELVRRLRDHGHRDKYFSERLGGNFRLDALQAAVLRVKLEHLDSWSGARQRNAARYRELFAETGLVVERTGGGEVGERRGIVLPAERADCRHIYNQFVISVHRDARPDLVDDLRRHGIGHEIYYPVPLHLQECFRELGYREGQLPVAEAASRQTLALPIFPELTEEQQVAVVNAVADSLRTRAA